jgi:hypothetical protein
MMSITTQVQPDRRTPERKEADERVANGDWTGFTREQLLPEDFAFDLVSRPDDIRREMAARLMLLPFNWKGKIYRITRCELAGDDVLVEVSPHDPAFVAEVKQRVESNRHRVLTYCQLFGFICFPEDYEKYKDY